MAIGDHHHHCPMLLHLRRQMQSPIETRGRRLPLQSPIGIGGFRGLVLLDLLIMMRVLRHPKHRIGMRDRPHLVRPMVMRSRRHKGKPPTETLDRHRKPKRPMMQKTELPMVTRDRRRLTQPPIRMASEPNS